MTTDEQLKSLKRSLETLQAEGDKHFRKINEYLAAITQSAELLASRAVRRKEHAAAQAVVPIARAA